MGIITLDNLKSYLGLTGTVEDAKLTIIVNAVNLGIDQYVGRKLAKDIYEKEIYDGPGTEALCLKNYPIISIEEILIMGIEVTEMPDDFTGTPSAVGYYYLQNPDTGILFHSCCWPSGRAIVKASYTAGYETMPDDIYFGALEMASVYRSLTKKSGILSESLGSYSLNTMNALGSMDGDLTIPSIPFKNILDRYRTNYQAHLVY